MTKYMATAGDRLLPALLLLAAILAGSPSLATAQPGVDESGDAIADQAKLLFDQVEAQPDLDRVWDYVAELRGLAATRQQVVRTVAQSAAAEGGAKSKLVAASLTGSVFSDGESAYDQALEVLYDSEDPEVQIAAARLVRTYSVYSEFAYEDLPEEYADYKDELTPAGRIAFAAATYYASGDEDARADLFAALESDNQRVREVATLALAREGELDREQLASLARMPNAAGQAAQALAEAASIEADIESERDRAENGGTRPAAPGDIAGLPDYSRKSLLESVALTVHRVMSVLPFDAVNDEDDMTPAERIEPARLLDLIGSGIANHVDDYTVYMTGEAMIEMTEDMEGQYGGIGASVNITSDGRCQISQPFYQYQRVDEETGETITVQGPAYAAGLRSGDLIVGGNGKDFTGWTLDEIVNELKGRPGTVTTVDILRRGWDEPRTFEVTRDQIAIDTAPHEMLPGNVGYIRLTQFGYNTDTDLENALSALLAEGMNSLVLDLRNNPGGSLSAVVNIVDRFLSGEKLITFLQGRYGDWAQRRNYRSTRNDSRTNSFPVMCLINGNSASGSELLSGALQDHERATILGETSFGKGVGQSFFRLDESLGDEDGDPAFRGFRRWLRVTTFAYYLPSGRSIQDRGVEPDIPVTTGRTFEGRTHSAEFQEWLGWQLAEIDRLAADVDEFAYDPFERYVDDLFAGDDDRLARLAELAEYDGFDTEVYPGFDQFYNSLETSLSRDDVRRLVRLGTDRRRTGGLRLEVADWRGQDFTQNYQEDEVLQRAIRELRSEHNIPLQNVTQYRHFLD